MSDNAKERIAMALLAARVAEQVLGFLRCNERLTANLQWRAVVEACEELRVAISKAFPQ